MAVPLEREFVQPFTAPESISGDRLLLICFLGDLRGKKVIDIGCGSGFLTREIARRTGKEGAVLGIDVNPEKINRAVKHPDKYPNLFYAMGMSNSLPAQSFDAAVLSRVINAISSKEILKQSFEEISGALVPGGKLVISQPDLLTFTPVAVSEGVLLVEHKSNLQVGDRVEMGERKSDGSTRKFSHYYWPPDALAVVASETGLKLIAQNKLKAAPDEQSKRPTHLQHAQFFDVLCFEKPGSG